MPTSADGTAPDAPLTPAQLDAFFARYGWQFERAADADGVWHTGFSEDRAEFELFVQLTEDWVVFMVYPFTLRPSAAARARMVERLATLNYELTMAKVGLDEDGDTFMAVELPRAGCTYGLFRAALDQLAEYALEYHMELELLAISG